MQKLEDRILPSAIGFDGGSVSQALAAVRSQLSQLAALASAAANQSSAPDLKSALPANIAAPAEATSLAVHSLVLNNLYSGNGGVGTAVAGVVQSVLSVLDGPVGATISRALSLVTGNDPPTIGAFDAPVTFAAEGDPVLLDDNATATDPDSANFRFGWMTVRLVKNGQPDDVLAIRNVGTGPGEVGVSGSQVTYGGTVIGTLTGGTGGQPLVLVFGQDATPEAVQAVLRNITFSSDSDTPSTLPRTVRIVLADGDGGLSMSVTKTINVTNV